ncbi:fork head protein homolog 2-like [Acanthaster planci]|uniref:Fork head protein homolog 2-like n=1 Tax=Acanthaster planci TaxID=133434 RepID=A0A8B7YS57_ACAPL|nr:fork head protein homolog 2-like [Acanthaster planci]
MMVQVKTEPMEEGGSLKNDGNQVSDREADFDRKSCPNRGRIQPHTPTTRRRMSTKGIRRPGYKRRVSAPHSYVELISMAIKASPSCMLTLREILAYLQEHNECFQGSYVGWKNSVRHNLSSSRCFVKLLRNSKRPFGKDNFWAMNPDCTHCQTAEQTRQGSGTLQASQSNVSSSQLAPRESDLPAYAFNEKSTGRKSSRHSNSVLPAMRHGRVWSNAPSPIFAEQPVEPSSTLLPAVTRISPPLVCANQPNNTVPASSTSVDNAVQLHPLDLSMPIASKKIHAHSPRKSAEGIKNSSGQPDPPSSPRLVKVSQPDEERCRMHHTLPISRFLNAPDGRTEKESHTAGPQSVHLQSRGVAPHQYKTSSFSPVPQYFTRLPSGKETCAWNFPTPETANPSVAASKPRATVPPDSVPRTPEELQLFKSLYEHYWNRAVQEREALYGHHLTMLQDRHSKPQNWYQCPVMYLPVSQVSDDFTGRSTNSLPPM